MKKNPKNVRLAAIILTAATLSFVSCSKDETAVEEEIIVEQVITATELKYSDESEMISEEVSTIAEDIYASDEISATSKFDYRSDYLPDCVTITTVVTDTTKEKTIDFGEGCELPNGNVLSGIINLSYAKDMEAASKTLTLALENFTFNGVSVEGGADILRVRSNENGNPQGTVSASFDATWPDGETASFMGTRTREWIEGYGSGFWGDNVFLITGKRTFVNKAGNTFEKEVVSPLRREWSCRFTVSGILEISRNDATASLDFGDGSCDAKGVLTYPDGTSEEVFLRRFLKD
ncbi:hypothetical protein MTsPCn9_33670 [Croceitalea sp. MTPC9]|uniref:hypothetical protein n=1 Tax=unclassified Croceitalea TaxID=2632280 RepID=UPI002B388C78|nr:hypothetical protein MTsPCn6_18360 [Croceitalea sp. MTPC6]GMN18427.1 hypothetical protein MTsPCn9_33670 [Croceitalea sp. MTPC9]